MMRSGMVRNQAGKRVGNAGWLGRGGGFEMWNKVTRKACVEEVTFQKKT